MLYPPGLFIIGNLLGNGWPSSLVRVPMLLPALSLRNFKGNIIIMPPSRHCQSMSLLPPAHVVIVIVVIISAAPTLDRLMMTENRVVLPDAAHIIIVSVARSLDFLFPANATQCPLLLPPLLLLLMSSLSLSATALFLLMSFNCCNVGGRA
jgi:hypothetical protein